MINRSFLSLFPLKKKKYVRFQDPWVRLFYFGFHLMQFVSYCANKTSLTKGFSYPLERLVILSMINSRESISKETAVAKGRRISSRTSQASLLYFWQWGLWPLWLALNVCPRINLPSYSSPRFCHDSSEHQVAGRGYPYVEINHQMWKEKDKTKQWLEFSNGNPSSRILFAVVHGEVAFCHNNLMVIFLWND